MTYGTILVFLRLRFAGGGDSDDDNLYVIMSSHPELFHLARQPRLISICPQPTHSSCSLDRNVGGQHPLLHCVKTKEV